MGLVEAAGRRKPVMVFAGEFWSGASGAGLADGFRSAGWAVQEVDYRHYGARSGRSLATRVASRLTKRTAAEDYRNRVINECQVLRPDVFLTIKGSEINTDTLRQVRETGAIAAMYYPDFHFEHPGVYPESFHFYDAFITTKTFQLDWLRQRLNDSLVGYVPHGYVDGVHGPLFTSIPESETRPCVSYSGNHSAYKQKWLEGLVGREPGLDITIIGNRWKENASLGPLAGKKMHDPMESVAYAKAIQMAKINIAIHMGETSSGWYDLVSTRTFEIPACRGFMLHIDNDEVREFFTPGVEIDVFSSVDELYDKVRFYLDRPGLREQMIDRAYARCVPAYGYRQRSVEILSCMSQSLLSGRHE